MSYAWFDLGNGRQVFRRLPEEAKARSNFPCPRLNLDTMDAVRSMASGKFYDSKSAIRAEYKELGVVEVGDDSSRLKPRKRDKPDRKAIRESLQKAASRMNA